MAFSTAKTALATLEEKLRRALGLAGTIGATFEPVLRPVLIAGDLREPGNSENRGRHFSYGQAMNFAAGNTHHSVLFGVDTLVLGFTFRPAVAGLTNRFYYTAPDQAIPAAVTVNAGVWTDRKQTAVDLVPLTVTNGSVALAGTAATIANTIFALSSLDPLTIYREMFIPAGGALTFEMITAGNATVGLWGRIADQR